jgi:hypothetical protein
MRPAALATPVCCVILVALLGVLAVNSSYASALEAVPRWTVTAVSVPTNFAPNDETGDNVYRVTVKNTGGAAAGCTRADYESEATPGAEPPMCPEDSPVANPITITDTLPDGLTLDRAGIAAFVQRPNKKEVPLRCEGLACTYSGKVIPDETVILALPVDVELKKPGTVTNVVRVSGGGPPDASIRTPTTISAEPAQFGIAAGSATTALSSMQAGAHADLTATLGFNIGKEGGLAGAPKEVVDDLPPGFAGDLVDTPTCPVAVFGRNECPIGTQVGITSLTFREAHGSSVEVDPVYNLAPEPGDVAKLGFAVARSIHIQGDVTVRPGDYGLQTRFQNIDQSTLELDSTSLTVWAVPAASVHDEWRWNGLPAEHGAFGASSPNALVPYLSSPTSCTREPVDASISARSWQEPEAEPASAQMSFGPFVDCDRLTMPSTFVAGPTTQNAYAPTGLDAELGVLQTYSNAEGLVSSHLNKAVVTLPEGMTINPSAGAGLGACTEEQYEQEAVETPMGEGCPNDSKLGSVRIQAPAIKEEAFGSVYIATPYENPFSEPGHPTGSLLALYVVARIPNRGVIVKSAGEVMANPRTGQLTTVFEDLPQLPFTKFTLSFRQGATSPLVSPPACGSYTAKAELTPWSNLGEVLTDLSPPFEINQGFSGGPCPAEGVPPFNPGVSAGMLDSDAGSYSPFEIRITRNDGEQEITGFSSQLPPGLTANLSGVPFCSEADIAIARGKTGAQEETEPSCPAASEIGQTLVGAGVGSVLAAASGKIYMAGPFEGAPFSIVAITSAKVGPFDLGTVVVHLPLLINPVTAAVSVPTGPANQIPHIIDGIVIHVRDIRVNIDRPDFTLSPTNCEPLSFAATVVGSGANFASSADDVPVTVSAPFRMTACQALVFKPNLQIFTTGKTSKANGASLTVKLTYPKAPQGTLANIAKVKVELPKRLPSRLTTLQKACANSVFEANPASCPAGSVVGTATAITPIIPVPLTGPAYFVSHGGAKFPELIIVLEGYGVTLDLHGETFISEDGITTSTFASVPDAPVGSFELKLPQGPHSALAANGNLCRGKLAMPTIFTAQDGAVIHQSTKIKVTGCSKKPKRHTKEVAAGRKHRVIKTLVRTPARG